MISEFFTVLIFMNISWHANVTKINPLCNYTLCDVTSEIPLSCMCMATCIFCYTIHVAVNVPVVNICRKGMTAYVHKSPDVMARVFGIQ